MEYSMRFFAFWKKLGQAASRKPRRARLEVEQLEDRIVPSNTPTGTVNEVSPTTGAVSGIVYNDSTGSGSQQTGDFGLADWTVQLQNSTGQTIATTNTDANGDFSFNFLAPGTYTVLESLPHGWTQTTAANPAVNVQIGDVVSVNFGDFEDLTIAGSKYNDQNGDGIWQPGEPGLPGWNIDLYTETAGQVSNTPLQSTATDANGNYAFTNLGPLPAGTSYVIAEEQPSGWTQTDPQAATADTIAMPDGTLGYIVPAVSGLSVNVPGGAADIAGTGSLAINGFNNNTVATIHFLNPQGQSQSIETYLTQFNATFTGPAGNTVPLETWCIDLTHEVSDGQTYQVYAQGNLGSQFTAAGPVAYIYQNYGEQNLSSNPVQAAAVQLAIWELMQNPTAISFAQNADGTYSAPGAEAAFSVSLGANSSAPQIAALVNQYLASAQGATTAGAWLNAAAQGNYLTRGQSVLLPLAQTNFGDVQPITVFNNTYFAVENQPLTVSAANGLLTSASNPSGYPLTAEAITQPQHGQLTVNPDGSFTYTPNPGYLGSDSFSFQAVNSFGLESNLAVMQLFVIARVTGDPRPVALPATYSVAESALLNVQAADGLVAHDQDPDGDALTASLVQRAKHGVVVVHADGSFEYEPDKGYVGPDSFTFRAAEPDGDKSLPAAVDLLVQAAAAPKPMELVKLNAGVVYARIASFGDQYTLIYDDILANGQANPAYMRIDVKPTATSVTVPVVNAFGNGSTVVLPDNKGLKSNIKRVEVSYGVEFDASFVMAGKAKDAADTSFYWIQYTQLTIKSSLNGVAQNPIIGNWALDGNFLGDKAVPNAYVNQKFNGTHFLTDTPSYGVTVPTKGINIVKENGKPKEVAIQLGKSFDGAVKGEIGNLAKAGISVSNERIFRTYLVKNADKPGGKVTPLGYIQWGFTYTGSKASLGVTATVQPVWVPYNLQTDKVFQNP